MVEWSERQRDQLYNVMELYEREAVNATDQSYELIKLSDAPLYLPINWNNAAFLRTSIPEAPLRLLRGLSAGVSLPICSFLLSCFIAIKLNDYANLSWLNEGLWRARELNKERSGGFSLYAISLEQTVYSVIAFLAIVVWICG